MDCCLVKKDNKNMLRNSFNPQAKTLFQTFHLNSKKKSTSIDYAKHLKHLILDTQSYITYSNYTKFPDLNDNPSRKNKFRISLKKFDNEMKWKKRNENKLDTMTTTYLSTIDIKKRGPIVITEPTKENFHKHHFNSNSLNENSLLKYIDDFNNINILYKYISYKGKYSFPVLKSDFSYFSKHLQEKDLKTDLLNHASSQIFNSFEIINNTYRVSLKCSSLTVIFRKEKSKLISNNCETSKESKQKLLFPFELLSFFYGLTYNDLKLFLSIVITYHEESSTFNVDKQLFDQYYVKFKENKELFGNNCLFLEINKEKQSLQFEYPWIIQGTIYIFSIKLPYYQFTLKAIDPKFKEEAVTIEKAINTRHMIHFMKTSFKDWDFFLMNCFSEYREFRSTINHYLSFIPHKKTKSKITLGRSSKKSIEDLSDSCWGFFYTNENNESFYMKLNAIKIQLYFKENEYRESQLFKFDLTMNQTKQLLLVSQQLPTEEILKRCLNIQTIRNSKKDEEIKAELSFKYFEDIDNNIETNSYSFENYENKDNAYEITIM